MVLKQHQNELELARLGGDPNATLPKDRTRSRFNRARSVGDYDDDQQMAAI